MVVSVLNRFTGDACVDSAALVLLRDILFYASFSC